MTNGWRRFVGHWAGFREVGQRVCVVRALGAGASEDVGHRDFPSDLLVTMVSQAQCIVVILNEIYIYF
ncbi:hypothetical protein WG66_004108, partial [Moniliophthora roreri]